jgi:nitrile hydratase accessory protein
MPQSLEVLMATRGLAPREAAFGAPWEARAFALALALADSGALEWESFRQRLIAAIAKSDAAAVAGSDAASYYECWLGALEDSLKQGQLVNESELDQRSVQIAANPPTPTRAIATGPIKVAVSEPTRSRQ